MNYLSPKAWHGWTAIGILAILFVVTILANGAHKTIKAMAWVAIVIVAAIAAYNSFVVKNK